MCTNHNFVVIATKVACACKNSLVNFTVSCMHYKVSGGYYEKVTPVPIPNTAVKLLSAENTWMVTSRENRSPPVLYERYLRVAGIFFYRNL